MTAPNHVAGGLFFTGFWASFWNINVFQKPEWLAVAILSTLIADIDHSSSPIGFIFFPFSRWLYRKYGHRTITHSLLFLAVSTTLIFFIEKQLISPELRGITIIFFFGALSHLILDMVTIRGVPLLYPLRRNPCVIPGRAEYRLQTGNLKSEVAAFFLFCCLNLICVDLYRQGFWFTYNNTFTTIEHVHFERANSSNFTLCQYHFVQQGKEMRGLAPIVDSKESSLQLFIQGRVITLDYSTPGLVLKSVRPVKTKFPFRCIKRSFYNATEMAINRFCERRLISGTIQSNLVFQLHFYKPDGNGTEETSKGIAHELANYTGTYITIPPATRNDTAAISRQIAIKEQSLIQDRINFEKNHAEFFALQRLDRRLKFVLDHTSDFRERNILQIQLIRIKRKLEFQLSPVFSANTVTVETIAQLKLQLNRPDSVRQYFNAELSYLDIPDSLNRLTKK